MLEFLEKIDFSYDKNTYCSDYVKIAIFMSIYVLRFYYVFV